MKLFNKVSWGVRVLIVLWIIALIVNPLTGQFLDSGLVWGLQHLILVTDKGFELLFKYVSYWAVLGASVCSILYGVFKFGQSSKNNVPKKTTVTKKQKFLET